MIHNHEVESSILRPATIFSKYPDAGYEGTRESDIYAVTFSGGFFYSRYPKLREKIVIFAFRAYKARYDLWDSVSIYSAAVRTVSSITGRAIMMWRPRSGADFSAAMPMPCQGRMVFPGSRMCRT